MAILVTGGMGFIGLHVIGQLLDAGEDVICTWNRSWRVHESWAEDVGKRVIAERVDVSQPHEVMNATLKHKVNGVVHLASPVIGTSNVTQDYTTNLDGLVNALEAANLAGVRRFTYVSSSTVYQGLKKGPYNEDEPLPLESKNPVEAFKKAGEIVAMHYADRLGMSLGIVRPRGVYGPMYYSMANLPSRLAHAAVKGTEPNYGPAGAPFADDGNDFSNVKRRGRANAHRAHGRQAAAPRLQRRQRQRGHGAAPGRRREVGGAGGAHRGQARQVADEPDAARQLPRPVARQRGPRLGAKAADRARHPGLHHVAAVAPAVGARVLPEEGPCSVVTSSNVEVGQP